MKKTVILSAVGVALLLILLSAGCVQQPNVTSNTTPAGVNILYTAGVGPMPQLLATKQVDGYIAWQPFPELHKKRGLEKLRPIPRISHRRDSGQITRPMCSSQEMIFTGIIRIR